jgi:hypothetical protein
MTGGAPLGTDPVLVASANQADRSKRPSLLVVLAVGVVVAALAFLASAAWGYNAGQDRFRAQAGQASQAWMLVGQIERLRAGLPSRRVYTSATLTPNKLRSAAAAAWDIPAEEVDDVVTIPAAPTRRTGRVNDDFTIATTSVSFSQQPLDRVLAFVQRALERPNLSTAFVSSLELRPAAVGWTGQVEFRQYEFNDEGPLP